MSEQKKEKSFQDLRDLYQKRAIARSHYEHCKEFRKSLKAQLMIEAEKEAPKMSAAMQERNAYANKKYVDFLDGFKVACEEYDYYSGMIKCREMEFETWRTKQANHRAEANLR